MRSVKRNYLLVVYLTWLVIVILSRITQATSAYAETSPYNCQPNDPPAKFVSQVSPPGQMNPGQTAVVSLTLANCSDTIWSKSSFKIGSQNPQDNDIWGITKVDLPSDVTPGQQTTVSFSITAPRSDGSYVFQWGVLQEGKQWYMPYSPPRLVTIGTIVNCPQAEALRNTGKNAADTLQTCFDNSEGKILELPAGIYSVSHELYISKPMILRTSGTVGNTKTCLTPGAPECAIIKVMPTYKLTTVNPNPAVVYGILTVSVSSPNGMTIDHIVVDFNKSNLPSNFCEQNAYHQSYNVSCREFSYGKIFYSAFINSPCFSSFACGGDSVTLAYNLVDNNGNRFIANHWSDGGTTRLPRSTFMYNILRNNSDIDLIIVNSPGAKVWFNTITHNNGTSVNSSFGGLMLDNFNSGANSDFTGADVSYNSIDCNYRCSFGVNIGPHPWYLSPNLQGGYVHHNTVNRAIQGINIDGAGTADQPLIFGHNTVTNSGGINLEGCPWQTNNLNISPDSNVQFDGDVSVESQHLWHPENFMSCVYNNTKITAPCSSPSVPTNLGPTGSVSAGSVTLSWDADPNVAKYALRINDLDDPSYSPNCESQNPGDICNNDLPSNYYTFIPQINHSYDWSIYAINTCEEWNQAATARITVISSTPTPTQTITLTPTPTSPLPTPTPSCLAERNQGDYNCNGVVDKNDFDAWLVDYKEGKTTLSYYEYWRRAFYR